MSDIEKSPTLQKDEESIKLQLGDIIQLSAPDNPDINDKIFLIKYIDNKRISLIDEESLREFDLTIDDDGNLDDKSITSIAILDRPTQPGYAAQNGLDTGKWINLHFGGDVPAIITGEITNVEEDMIEVRTYPDNELIYIDFAYKGIPEDLPIDKIVIRDIPDSAKEEAAQQALQAEIESQTKAIAPELLVVEAEEEPIPKETEYEVVAPSGVTTVKAPDVKSQIKEMIIGADQIQLGLDLEAITQEIAIEPSAKRFGLDKQVNDLLDELLSTIPNSQRTQTVLNNIHVIIERFKQLRSEFSDFDSQGNANMPKKQGAGYKPLVESLQKLNQNILWLLPIAKNRKKLYDIEQASDVDDAILLNSQSTLNSEINIIDNYRNNNITDGQNKYDYLIQQITPYETPFESPDPNSNFIISKFVETNLNTVVDNLEDLYSSVAVKSEFLGTKRFLIQKYDLGMSKLKSERLKTGTVEIKRDPITRSDEVYIKGLLTLPEQVSTFSKINLPATSIIDRSQLSRHYVNYWQLLRKRTSITTTIVDDINKPIQHDHKVFLKGIRQYLLDETISDEDRYEKYLEAVIPRTRVLFELVKKYIKAAYSLKRIVDYLQPFLVYHRDISFKQYEVMTAYVRYQIREYKKTFATIRKEYQTIKTQDLSKAFNNELFNKTLINLLKGKLITNDADLLIMNNYGLNENEYEHQFSLTSSEQLSKMINSDYADAFTSTLALAISDLIAPGLIEELIEAKIDVSEEITNNQSSNTCNNFVIAKLYLAKDELDDDNGKEIYFDKKYDNTPYDLLKQFKSQKTNMPPDQFKNFLINHIMTEMSLSKEVSERITNALIKGKKLVQNGDYAILETEDDNGLDKRVYYRRVANAWVLDTDDVENYIKTDDQTIFCDTKPLCFQENITCDNFDMAELKIVEKDLKNIVKEYDYHEVENKNTFISLLKQKWIIRRKTLKNLIYLLKLKENAFLKYTNEQYKIGLTSETFTITESPYDSLRDLILGQDDFVKKQHDIIKFTQRFTIPGSQEDDIYWLYCKTTGVKLLPSFIPQLAQVFIENPESYQSELQNIKAQRGTISDDGNMWVDKHSGYPISIIEYSTEEGYTEEGFKSISRAELEADIGESILVAGKKKREFISPEAEMIYNVANSMASFMGINIDDMFEFIIGHTLIKQKQSMPSEAAYNKSIEKAIASGKKGKYPTYKESYNASLVYITLCYFLISIQTSIPSIRTNKVFPGCKRSFSGYPMNGTTDLSAITYIACIANKIKSSTEPWNGIQTSNEAAIIKKMQAIMDKYVISDGDVQQMFEKKQEYLKIEVEEDIPLEHDIRNWTNFLPPLVKPYFKTFENISETFKDKLLSNLKSGSREQIYQIETIQGKIIKFSIAIQELIQKTITSQKALLTSNGSEPYLENACCETQTINTFKYFSDKQPEIIKYNEIVQGLNHILYDLGEMGKAAFLFDPEDTKVIYPPISKTFSEETIYRAFIVYCRFNSLLPINTDLQEVCLAKPDSINITDSFEEKMKKLKDEGRNYGIESLQQLMQVVNRRNIVKLNLFPTISEKINILYDNLSNIKSKSDSIISKTIIDNQIYLISSFNQGTFPTEAIRIFRNNLGKLNDEFKLQIYDFIEKNISKVTKSKLASIRSFLDDPMSFPSSSANYLINGENNAVYRALNYMQNTLRNIIDVYPNMIINKVDYRNVSIPKHWALSVRHNSDIILFLHKYYLKFHTYYSDNMIDSLLKSFIVKCNDILTLVNTTPYSSKTPYARAEEQNILYDDRTTKMLLNYYFYRTFKTFIDLINEKDIYVANMAKAEETDPEVRTDVVVDAIATGEVDELEIVRGEKKALTGKVASLMQSMFDMVIEDKDMVDYDYDQIMERVLRAKEKEKDLITDYLKEMTDEERQIENNFKKAKLGRWGVGLQKGLVQYVAETYDQEREDLDQQIIKEMKLGKSNLVSEMNKEIYAYEMDEAMLSAYEIEKEAYDMTGLGEDNDDMLDFDDNDGY